MHEESFVFVALNGPYVPVDEDTRLNIRRQAMSRVKSKRQRLAEEEKRKPKSKSRNQFVPLMSKDESILIEANDERNKAAGGAVTVTGVSDDVSVQVGGDSGDLVHAIPPTPVPMGYEAVRMKYGFDIIELSGFTTYFMTHAEVKPYLSRPSEILARSRYNQWSFFWCVPARFGHSKCCDDAVICLAAACQSIIKSDTARSPEVLLLYGRALKSLQKAIDAADERLKPDTLCAVQILAAYELFNVVDEGDKRWAKHMMGAASLTSARGLENHKTDFEKGLLLAQAGPLVTQAIIDDRYCMFDGYEWKSALRSLTSTAHCPLSNDNKTIPSLWMSANRIPRLFTDVMDIVYDSSGPRFDVLMEVFFARAKALRQHMTSWLQDYDSMAISTALGSTRPPIEDTPRQSFEAHAFCLGGVIMVNRLLIATNLTAENANSIEDETQKVSHHMLQLIPLWNRSKTVIPPGKQVQLAKATILSEASWRHAIASARSGGPAMSLLRDAVTVWRKYNSTKVTGDDAWCLF